MFEKVIEFSAHEDYFALKEDYPTPIKLNIPEWYKKLDHGFGNFTVKGCIPFLDTLTSGYLLRMPQDFHVRHNVKNKHNLDDSFQTFALHSVSGLLNEKSINLNSTVDIHNINQIPNSPFIEKNKNLPFYKILNPWKIKTPKGYSCLFLPPLNNSDDRFSIIPGIVDTDTFPIEINFPIIINGDKYPILETLIKKGTPYVQIIPFKRDNWKMKLKSNKETDLRKNQIFFRLKILNVYKDKFWSKKSWK
jgi:hypothetical protein